jgi:hypothetical protein
MFVCSLTIGRFLSVDLHTRDLLFPVLGLEILLLELSPNAGKTRRLASIAKKSRRGGFIIVERLGWWWKEQHQHYLHKEFANDYLL